MAAAGSDGLYRRASLEEMVHNVMGQMQYLDRVEVFTVNCGEKKMVKPSDLSNLPYSLGGEMFPSVATKVVVGGIMAMDMDRDWGVQASMYVSSMMEGQGDKEVVCRGRVLLHMSDTVWLERCQVMVRQPTLAKFVCTFETVSWLVREGFATINKNHMELLYKIAEKAGIPIPEVRDESLDTSMVEEGVEIKSRTAFLPQDEVVTAYMSECMTPLHFYLHRVAFVDILNRLEKDITDWVEKENIPYYNFRPKEEEIVLVRAEGETFFRRARVVKMLGSRQMEEEDAEPRVDDMISLPG